MKVLSCLAVSVLLFSVPIVLLANDSAQSFSISKNLSGENTNQAIAVSSKTGDVLVAWERSYNKGGATWHAGIYYIFAKRNENGTYQVSNPKYLYKNKKLGEAGNIRSETFQFPEIEYNPSNDTFLAVFDSGTLLMCKAQVVDANGKKVGKAKEIWPNNSSSWDHKDMTELSIRYIPNSKSPGSFMAFFRHDFRHNSDEKHKAGLYTGILDATGRLISEEPQGEPLFPHVIDDTTAGASTRVLTHRVNSVIFTPKGSVLIGYDKPVLLPNNNYHYVSGAARLNTKGKLINKLDLSAADSWGSQNIVELKKNLYLFVWQGDASSLALQGNSFMNTLFNAKLKKKGTTKLVLPDFTVSSTVAVKLGKNSGSYQVFKPSNVAEMWGRYLTPGSNYGKAVKLMDTYSSFIYLKAVAIPATNQVFVAWIKSNSSQSPAAFEIRGFVFNAVN